MAEKDTDSTPTKVPLEIKPQTPDLKSLPVTMLPVARVQNPNPKGETSVEEFSKVRQDMTATLRRFGPVAPDKDPDYILYEHQYNDDLLLYLEVKDPTNVSPAWLQAVQATLARHPGWGVVVKNLRYSQMGIFADRLEVGGPAFQNARDGQAVLEAIRQNLWGLAEKTP